MSGFSGELDCRYLDGSRWLILSPFTYHLGPPDGREFVRVHAGEIINFASIPRPLKLIWPSPGGPWDKGSAGHDSLYVHPFVYRDDGTSRRIERDEADRLFDEMMKVTGTNGLTRRLMYRGVRLGGGGIWDRYRAAEAAQLAAARKAADDREAWWFVDPWAPDARAA